MVGLERMQCMTDRCLAPIVWIMALVVALGAPAALGQIDVNETDLHGGEEVAGLATPTTPVPALNGQSINLRAWGVTDPNLYEDISFYAAGLFSEVALINSGAIDVNAVGGAALGADLVAFAEAYGIYGEADVNNTGPLTVLATGGTADANNIAFASIGGWGIGSEGAVLNEGAIDVSAVGGTAEGPNTVTVETFAVGIEAPGDVNNIGDISVTAAGGAGTGGAVEGATYAAAIMHALDQTSDVNNIGDLIATATGGISSGTDVNAPGLRGGRRSARRDHQRR